MYFRVKDPDTGHEFDLPEGHRLLRLELVKQVKPKLYPPSLVPRPPKHHIPRTPAIRPDQSASEPSAPHDATDIEE